MNLVFKLVTGVFWMISLTCLANETSQCGTVNFIPNEEYVISLIGVDYIPYNKKSGMRQLKSGDVEYNLPAGEHQLTLMKIPKRALNFSSAVRHNVENGKLSIDSLSLNIQPNQKYDVVFKEADTEIEFFIDKQTTESCNIEEVESNLIDRKEYLAKQPLPKDIEAQLFNVMTKIYQFHQQQGGASKNIIPLKADEYFGTVIDDQFTEGNYLKILAVLPMSMAYQLGLRSGDIITALSNADIPTDKGTPRQIFDEYLTTVAIDENYIFDLQRNGERKHIQQRKQLNLLPASRYVFDIAQPSTELIAPEHPLNAQLEFEYERMVLALFKYYQSQGFTENEVIYQHPAHPSRKMGLQGEEIKGAGLLVTNVSKSSPLYSVGIKSGDLIVNINNSATIDSAKLLLDETQKLKEGEQIKLLIEREHNKLELFGVYQLEIIPSFIVKLNMDSKDYLANIREIASKYRQRVHHMPAFDGIRDNRPSKSVNPDSHRIGTSARPKSK